MEKESLVESSKGNLQHSDTNYSLLSKKSKRDSDSMNSTKLYQSLCDFCLDPLKSNNDQLIECEQCHGQAHSQCLKRHVQGLDTNSKASWLCIRCLETKYRNRNFETIKCVICANFEGILVKVNETEFAHFKCVRFIKELCNDQKISNLNLKTSELRKWRKKENCKACKSETEALVLKCMNTHCKYHVHINCAIEKELIMSLEFMYNFYSIDADKLEEQVPFYCGSHARELLMDYGQIKKQWSIINSEEPTTATTQNLQIKEVRNEFNTEEQNLTEDPLSLMNLSHPEFNFLKTNTPQINKSQSHLGQTQTEKTTNNNNNDNSSFSIHKPNLDDSFYNPGFGFLSNEKVNFNLEDINLNFSNVNETKIVGSNNSKLDFAKVSKCFYDHFKQDCNRLKTEKKSNITLTELKELKEFLVLVIRNYKTFDSDLNKIYNKLFEQPKTVEKFNK